MLGIEAGTRSGKLGKLEFYAVPGETATGVEKKRLTLPSNPVPSVTDAVWAITGPVIEFWRRLTATTALGLLFATCSSKNS